MLYCIKLYYIILSYIILCKILYYTKLYYIIFILHYILLYSARCRADYAGLCATMPLDRQPLACCMIPWATKPEKDIPRNHFQKPFRQMSSYFLQNWIGRRYQWFVMNVGCKSWIHCMFSTQYFLGQSPFHLQARLVNICVWSENSCARNFDIHLVIFNDGIPIKPN